VLRACFQVVQTNGNTRLSTNLMVLSLGPQLLAKVPELTPDLTMGMTLAELAKYMAGLGCTDAMNLDGGKSAQMCVESLRIRMQNPMCVFLSKWS
jgi:Phosphodiester glycosidase